jgi:hypothetical protein
MTTIAWLSDAFRQVTHPEKPSFTRGDGFWSKSTDEEKTGFFNRLTESPSQRENWYQVTPYIAEFWCTVSNVGLLAVGFYRRSFELVFAGSASVVSHTIPKQWLLLVDKIGAALVVLKLFREYKVIIENPFLIKPVAALGMVFVTDVCLARLKGITLPHVIWHLSAAAVAGFALGYVKS